MSDTIVHATEAPLQHPAKQAADLVKLHQDANGGDRTAAVAHVRELVGDDVAHPDPRRWAVQGYGRPLTGGVYHALVLAEVDKLAIDVTGKQYREQAEHIERLAWAIANGQVRGPMHAAAARLKVAVDTLVAWTPDDRSVS